MTKRVKRIPPAILVPTELAPVDAGPVSIPESTVLQVIRLIPEHQVWLDSLKTENTRRAYKKDVAHFAYVTGIDTSKQLYSVDYRAVLYWEKYMREMEGLEASTIRRRLSALSSLFRHLVKYAPGVEVNPVREIERPKVDRSEGKTLAFSNKEARKILDCPDEDSLQGKRDRAILSVGFQAGFRREEIAQLQVDALHKNRGLAALWVRRKRKRNRQSITINPQTAARIRDYLGEAGHAHDSKGPMFRPLRNNGHKGTNKLRRNLAPDLIDKILRKYAKLALGVTKGYSAHSMRATFATTALENDADIEEVQQALGHADISTTKLYDKRGHNPEKAAAFFANY